MSRPRRTLWLGLVLSWALAAPLPAQEVLSDSDVKQAFNQASTLGRKGNYRAAADLLEKLLPRVEAERGKDNLWTAATLALLGEQYIRLGKYAQAAPVLRRSLEVRQAMLPRDHFLVAASHNLLGLTYHYQGDFARAETHYKHTLAIFDADPKRYRLDRATMRNNLAGLYRETGQYAKSEKGYLQAGHSRSPDLLIR
jgi:tetratricopeptide (TPR) repeat protein